MSRSPLLFLISLATVLPLSGFAETDSTAEVICSKSIKNEGAPNNPAIVAERAGCEEEYRGKAGQMIRDCALRSAPSGVFVNLKSYECQEAGGQIRAYGTKNSHCVPRAEIPKFEACLESIFSRISQEYAPRANGSNSAESKKLSPGDNCAWGIASSIACKGNAPSVKKSD